MTEQQLAERFLVNQLFELPEPVFSGAVPDGAPYPVILFCPEGATDELVQGQRQMSVFEYRVVARAVGWAYPFPVQAAIDEALHGRQAVLEGVPVSCERVRSILSRDRIGETEFREAGGLYRIALSPPLS